MWSDLNVNTEGLEKVIEHVLYQKPSVPKAKIMSRLPITLQSFPSVMGTLCAAVYGAAMVVPYEYFKPEESLAAIEAARKG